MNPTPAGVPVRITSPGNSVINLKVRSISLLRISTIASYYYY